MFVLFAEKIHMPQRHKATAKNNLLLTAKFPGSFFHSTYQQSSVS